MVSDLISCWKDVLHVCTVKLSVWTDNQQFVCLFVCFFHCCSHMCIFKIKLCYMFTNIMYLCVYGIKILNLYCDITLLGFKIILSLYRYIFYSLVFHSRIWQCLFMFKTNTKILHYIYICEVQGAGSHSVNNTYEEGMTFLLLLNIAVLYSWNHVGINQCLHTVNSTNVVGLNWTGNISITLTMSLTYSIWEILSVRVYLFNLFIQVCPT